MSIVHLIDTIAEWAQVNICNHVQLKQPPKDLDAADDERLDYQLIKPAAFPMYVPTSEKLPPNIHSPFPSLCVRFANGADEPAASKGSIKIEFCFSAWDPGTHGLDLFEPNGDATFRRKWTADEAKAYFKRNADGWRDVWNFVDVALRALESTVIIGGHYTIDRTKPIEFGPLKEQEAIADFYPFWFAWVSFTVNYDLRRNIAEIQHLL